MSRSDSNSSDAESAGALGVRDKIFRDCEGCVRVFILA